MNILRSVFVLLFISATSAFAAAPEGWFLAGSHPQDYATGIEQIDAGKSCGFLRSRGEAPDGFGTLMQSFSARRYAGKRLRLTAAVRAENVEGWAGVWMRIDGQATQLAFDNMQGRPIRGTSGWRSYEVVLDVPPESVSIHFGILLNGAGAVWIDDVRFDEVAPARPAFSDKPRNLDFEVP